MDLHAPLAVSFTLHANDLLFGPIPDISTRRRERSRDRARSSLASPTRTDEPSFHGRLS